MVLWKLPPQPLNFRLKGPQQLPTIRVESSSQALSSTSCTLPTHPLFPGLLYDRWDRSDPPSSHLQALLTLPSFTLASLTLATLSPLPATISPRSIDLTTCSWRYSTANHELCLPPTSANLHQSVLVLEHSPSSMKTKTQLLSNGTPSLTRDIRPKNGCPTWSSSNSLGLGWRQQKAPSALVLPPIT